MPTKYENNRLKTGLASAAVLCVGGALTAMTAMSAPSVAAPGNNGTVKVAPYGDVDAIPNNHPHVGCTFQLEWFGFDADVTSTVLFEEQAPTTGVGMTVAGDTTAALDGDPGSGAGNDGFDGTQVYTLSFTGAPHPQQGYHVKLTIDTPESNGASVKHKVFWVEGCDAHDPRAPTPPRHADHDAADHDAADHDAATTPTTPTRRRRPRRRRPRRRRPRRRSRPTNPTPETNPEQETPEQNPEQNPESNPAERAAGRGAGHAGVRQPGQPEQPGQRVR